MLNKFIGMGRLVADPEMKYTSDNRPYINFRVAISRNYKNARGEVDTDFFNATAWNKKAEFIAKHFTKGKLICLEGAFEQRNYTDNEGVKRTSYEIKVDQAHFAGDRTPSANVAPPESTPADSFVPDFGAFSSCSDDFEEIVGEDDIPFMY